MLALAVLLAIGVATFAGPCVHDDGTAAACHGAAHVVLGLGIAGCVLALASLVIRNKKASSALALLTACCGAIAAVAPGTLFALCMMQTMRCWTIMRPFVLVCGGCLCVLGVIAAITVLLASGKPAGRASV